MKIPDWLIFNFFTNISLKQAESIPFLGNRAKSMLTDFGFVLSIFFPILVAIMVPLIILESHNPDNPMYFYLYMTIIMIPWSIMNFVLLNKDFCNGKSIAKRIYGYQIIDSHSKEVANDFQCMLRNVTMIVWPLEAIALLINPNKRIGDIIAGTEIVKAEIELKETLLVDLKTHKKISRKLLLTSLGIVIFFNVFEWILTIL